MSERIQKRLEPKAPVSRVWRALTDYREFGEWFRVKLEGPFVPGETSRGQMTYPGYEHLRWGGGGAEDGAGAAFFVHLASVRRRSQEGLFGETPTLVEFRIESAGKGTLLVLTESGFDKVPGERRVDALRMNDGGWTEQMKNVESFIAQKP